MNNQTIEANGGISSLESTVDPGGNGGGCYPEGWWSPGSGGGCYPDGDA